MTGPQLGSIDRRLLVGGAGLAGVVLGWVLLMTVFGADGSDGEVGLPRAPGTTTVASTTAPPTTHVTYVPAGRDPFQPNVTVPRAPPAAQSPVPAATVPAVATTAPANSAANASLELKSIAPDRTGTVRATITVDGKTYTPATGEAFSPHGYRLERIDGSCVEVSAQAVRAQMCVAAK